MEFIFIILISWLIIAVALKLTKPKSRDYTTGYKKTSSALATAPVSINTVWSTPSVTEPANPYHYSRRRYLMTQAENAFFKMLVDAVGTHANVFPQVRLSALLFRTQGIERRYWHAALARINQKSVDYVLCDKVTGEVLLVIELDDPTHDTTIRQKRDAEVNEMLEEAGVPFLRFRDVRQLTIESIAMEVYEIAPLLFKEPGVTTPAQSIAR
jgi:very-short-patch-repair endonuclease